MKLSSRLFTALVFMLLSACTQVQPPGHLPGVQTTAIGYVAKDLGDLGGRYSSVRAISSDGSVLVGTSTTASGDQKAFRWTEAGGMQDIGYLNEGSSYYAYMSASADGSVVASAGETADNQRQAFRWTVGGGKQYLGTFGGDYPFSLATAVSADGSVVVGWSSTESHGERAFRWTEAGGLQDLGMLPGQQSWPSYRPTSVSADGTVVVGEYATTNGIFRAFRWTAASGMQDLGVQLGNSYDSGTRVIVSADGSVIVGNGSDSPGTNQAFRWTTATGAQELGTLGGTVSYPLAISADGSVVAGKSTTASGLFKIFRWTASAGIQDLGTPGETEGADLAMSADGSVIVGSYTDASAREVRGFRWTAAGGLENLHSLGGTYNGATAVSADGKVIAGYRRDSMTTRAVRWTLQTVPEVNTYTINLQTALLNRILWKVQLGRGITGPSSPGNVAVYGERRINGVIRSGNHAKAINVWGGKRLAIIKAGTATPNPSGGPLRLRFYPGFSDGHVKVKELKVFNIISDDATLTLLRRNQVVRHINLPRTGSGMGATIRLNEPNVTTIRIDAPHAFAIDGIVFENERE